MTEPLLIGVSEAAGILGTHKNAVYQLVREGRLPAVRIGATSRRVLIPRQALAAWVMEEARRQAGEFEAAR